MSTNRSTIHFSIFCAAVVLMMVGFLCSRALLSIGTFIMIANGFLQGDFRERWSLLKADKFLLGISCLFIFPFISGLWSSNMGLWLESMQDKLPLLLLPFAMIIQKDVKQKHIVLFGLLWILFLFAGSLWSAAHYIGNQQTYEALYRLSKTIPVPASDDHIRFSMAIIIALLLWMKLEEWNAVASATLLWLFRSIAFWLVIYLHLLGAKTGLLGLYLIVLPLFVWQLIQLGKKQATLLVILLALSLPVVAYYGLSTFRVRVHYVLYERENWQSENLTGNFSDANRLLTIRSGWHVFSNNWLTGVGYGDIKEEAEKWYKTHAPAVPESERFLPLNQWMMSGSGAGILAMLLFTVVMLLPFTMQQWKQHRQALAFILFMNLVFLYESTIDDQYGVFLFCFFILYWNLFIRTAKY